MLRNSCAYGHGKRISESTDAVGFCNNDMIVLLCDYSWHADDALSIRHVDETPGPDARPPSRGCRRRPAAPAPGEGLGPVQEHERAGRALAGADQAEIRVTDEVVHVDGGAHAGRW